MATSNKELIEEKVKELGFKLGCYDDMTDKVSKKEIKKVISALSEDWTDVPIKIRSKEYVVEIATVDEEKDIMLLSREEYIDRYGCPEDEDE